MKLYVLYEAHLTKKSNQTAFCWSVWWIPDQIKRVKSEGETFFFFFLPETPVAQVSIEMTGFSHEI